MPPPRWHLTPTRPLQEDSDTTLTCLHPGEGMAARGFSPAGVSAEEVHAEQGGVGGWGGSCVPSLPAGKPRSGSKQHPFLLR